MAKPAKQADAVPRVMAGASGFSYKPWRGPFYPEKLPEADMLAFYASRLPTVEINNSFYRMPRENVLAAWAEKTPPAFRFALKAPQRITHQLRLKEAGEATGFFFRVADVLGDRLGPALFQLPPYMRQDLGLLESFLAGLPKGRRVAFEFRHASWFDDAVFAALRAHDAALCINDTEETERSAPVVATAGLGYLRLRRPGYDEAALRGWAQRIAAQPWSEAFVFFKHEDDGAAPRLAAGLMALLPGARPAAPQSP